MFYNVGTYTFPSTQTLKLSLQGTVSNFANIIEIGAGQAPILYSFHFWEEYFRTQFTNNYKIGREGARTPELKTFHVNCQGQTAHSVCAFSTKSDELLYNQTYDNTQIWLFLKNFVFSHFLMYNNSYNFVLKVHQVTWKLRYQGKNLQFGNKINFEYFDLVLMID